MKVSRMSVVSSLHSGRDGDAVKHLVWDRGGDGGDTKK